MFGVPSNATSSGSGKDPTFRAFHIYSMQQAIEEKFILDVLTNYTTYKQYYELSVKTKNTLQYDENTLLRETKKMIGKHDFRIRKIVEYICEHFESIGSKTINSEGKAMIITSSREEAVKYTKILRNYLKSKNHSDWGVLVAISGKIDDLSERDYNSFPQNPLCKKGTIITENQTAATFHEKEYRFLVVADKYQTGFSEKLLSCMYVDKKLKDIRAVQTLSRLNRTIGGGKKSSETDCFVVDFVNERKVIQEAFQKFYGDIKLIGEITLTDLDDAKASIENCGGLIVKSEIDDFIKLYGQKLVAKNEKDIKKVESLNSDIDNLIQDNLIQRYKTKPENEQKEFFEKCRDFNKKFLFLQNIVSITDVELVYFGLYITNIINPLKTSIMAPHLVGNTQIEIEKLLSLSSYRIDDKITGAIQLSKGNNATVNTISTAKGTNALPAITTVHKLVTELNQRLSTDFTDEDIVPVIEVFKKCFEADKNFCNENVIRQENIFTEKYKGNEGARVFSNALNSNQIKKEVAAAIRKPNVYQSIKDELYFPIYEHLKSVLKIA